MSVLWMDDPSFYTSAQITSRYNAITGMGVAAGVGRFGGQGWTTNGVTNARAAVTVATAVTGTLGVSFKWGGSAALVCGFLDSASIQVDLRVNGAGQLFVTRNGTQIGSTSTNALASGTWYRIEFKATIDPSAGVIEVRVFGTSIGWVPSTSGLNTRNTANTSFNQVQFGGSGNGGTSFYSDFVYTDTNSPNANFLGDKRCFLLSPSADSSVTWTATFAAWAASTVMTVGQQIVDSNGNVQQVQSVTSDAKTGSGSHPTWATSGGLTTVDNHVTWVVIGSGANPGAHNWMAVSEIPNDGDNSYNTSATPGQVDLFSHPNLPAGAQNIAAVDNVVVVRKDDAGTRSVASQIKSSTTTSTGATVALSNTYTFVDQIAETDPNTSAAWTASGVNGALFGYKEIA